MRPGVIPLDGNSVEPLGGTSPAGSRRFVEHRWGARAARCRPDHDRRPETRHPAHCLAPLIGADPAEITVADSTSMNLFRALLAAARLRCDRPVLVLGRDCFAADRYLARSAADFTGCELVLLDRLQDLPEVLDGRVAAVALSHVDPVSGAVRDSAAITAEIHRAGALALWELSRSAGALRVDMHAASADFAVGCGSKYLGGGHGAPAYCFVARRHHDSLRQAPQGVGADRAGVLNPLATGFAEAPPEQSMSGFRAGLAVLDGVSPAELEAKTRALIELFLSCLDQESGTGVEVLGPPGGAGRGSQLAIRHRHAQYLMQGMFARGILVDFVEPDILRLGFAPAWLRYVDAWEAAEALNEALADVARHTD